MRKILTMPQFLAVCFITILSSMCLCTYLIINSIENLTDAVNESKQQQPVAEVAYEEPEREIVYCSVEYQYGDIIIDYGDVSDEFHFYVVINEEQGQYEYYFPAMHLDWPIECDSLEELQCVINCHIDQAYPNATFVMR